MANRVSKFLAELKRRKVYCVVGIYVAVAVGTIGFADSAFGGTWAQFRILVVAGFVVGLPIAIVLAWAYDLRPESEAPDLSQTPAPERGTGPTSDADFPA